MNYVCRSTLCDVRHTALRGVRVPLVAWPRSASGSGSGSGSAIAGDHVDNGGPNRKPEAYLSRSNNPWFNLALEDHLFRTRDPDTPVCLLYRNDRCVVVGRNQNPWKELNIAAMRQSGIPLVRRRSGGGTVYHDLGNTNYSFHVSRNEFTRRAHAELVARALNGPPVNLKTELGSQSDSADGVATLGTADGAYVNSRNDICVRVHTGPGPAETQERKVSGSAYKLVNKRAYHHGTMLLSASLSSLGSALRNERGDTLVSKGVASVPAPVTNLRDVYPSNDLSHETFVQAVVREFGRVYAPQEGVRLIELDESSLDSERGLRAGYDELQSWEWTYGQTPEFTHLLRSSTAASSDAAAAPTYALHRKRAEGFDWGSFTLELTSRGGLVTHARLSSTRIPEAAYEQALRRLVGSLEGERYDVLATAPASGCGTGEGSQFEQSVQGSTRPQQQQQQQGRQSNAAVLAEQQGRKEVRTVWRTSEKETGTGTETSVGTETVRRDVMRWLKDVL